MIKYIKDIEIGDTLHNNKVLGKIEIYGKALQFYNDRGVYVTSNTETLHNGAWKNVELTPVHVWVRNSFYIT